MGKIPPASQKVVPNRNFLLLCGDMFIYVDCLCVSRYALFMCFSYKTNHSCIVNVSPPSPFIMPKLAEPEQEERHLWLHRIFFFLFFPPLLSLTTRAL